MRRLKLGIRPQLIILVGFSSLFSLLILSIVCGVYFSHNINDLRSERLEVIAELKATQIQQLIVYLYYQVSWLSDKDLIILPLLSYRAGNNLRSIFSQAQSTLDLFLSSSEVFASSRLYNLDLEVMAESDNDDRLISNPTKDYLYPLSANATLPSALLDSSSDTAFYTGPMSNSSDINSEYFLGVTVPVYANSSIIIDEPSIAGYLTVLASASNIQSAFNDTIGGSHISDYTVLAVKAVYENSQYSVETSSLDTMIGFELLFPIDSTNLVPNEVYSINSSDSIKDALSPSKTSGSARNLRLYSGDKIAIGFMDVSLDDDTSWTIIIEQKMSTFSGPSNKLTKIIVGVVIGIGVFMCLVTFPLAVLFVRPISKLREATESITRLKKPKKDKEKQKEVRIEPDLGNNLRHRFSSTSSSDTMYSSGIRIPGRIDLTKNFFKDELSGLAEAFNIMIDELDKQYTHLEDRVRSRTKELEALKLEAEAANQAKTVFIANISHELRTPLNGILGMTSIAMEENDPSRIQDSLRLIHRSGELLLHILTELLTYSKNTLKRSKLEKSNFQILEIVYQVQSIFGKLAVDQLVHFSLVVKPSVMRKLILYGDSNRIIQIVMNLVSNSLKFTPVDGSVDVFFKLLGEYDYENSLSENFEKVYVKKSTKDETTTHIVPKSPLLRVQTSLDSLEKTVGARSKSVSSFAADAVSVVTLSTVEYENTIFHSQFKDLSKPLPLPPSSKERFDENEETELENHENDNIDGNGEKFGLKPPHQLQQADRKALIYSQSNHSSEIIKNDRLYRTKNLYQPRTWVLQIEVVDTGPGIEPALQEKVFEPFIQGDQTLSRSYGGTGLGLSICRQLARMMNGTLTLKSTIGKGSRFIFTVPLPQTGEIEVAELELASFCDDEFNPNKIKKGSLETKEHPGYATDNTVGSTPPRGIHFDDGETETPTVKIDGPSSPSLSSDGSDKKFKFKLDIPSRAMLFEKPHLITRSSTGTANSSNDHNLLDGLSHLRILVAEDNMVNQEVIKRMLKLEGFLDVTMAGNGAEAVELVKESYEKQEIFDIIFMDVQMPKIDGLTATKMIRNNLKFTKPIIALTAFADESNVKVCLNSGMSGFLAKPIKKTNLRKIITEFSPELLDEIVTTPNTHQSDERRLGYGSSYESDNDVSPCSTNINEKKDNSHKPSNLRP